MRQCATRLAAQTGVELAWQNVEGLQALQHGGVCQSTEFGVPLVFEFDTQALRASVTPSGLPRFL